MSARKTRKKRRLSIHCPTPDGAIAGQLAG